MVRAWDGQRFWGFQKAFIQLVRYSHGDKLWLGRNHFSLTLRIRYDLLNKWSFLHQFGSTTSRLSVFETGTEAGCNTVEEWYFSVTTFLKVFFPDLKTSSSLHLVFVSTNLRLLQHHTAPQLTYLLQAHFWKTEGFEKVLACSFSIFLLSFCFFFFRL